MKLITPFLNPIQWIKAYKFHKQNLKYDKSTYDLELYLYSKILTNDMLHYGFFHDPNVKPETISLKQLEDAQITYAENIIDQITDNDKPVLDVGCGMGGLSELMLKKNLTVEALTPNENQINYIKTKKSGLASHHCKFEEFNTDKKFGTVINSESLQYIKLDDAFKKVDKILLSNGKWIICDYFRINKNGIDSSGHMLDEFKKKVKEFNWEIIHEQDITKNILPTLSFGCLYVDRFLLPLKHVAIEKLRFKKGWLFYLTKKIRESIDKKIVKEKASIDVDKFIQEKKYMLFSIQKN